MTEKEPPWEKLKGQIILGNVKFAARVREIFGGKEQFAEIPRLQQTVGRPSLKFLLSSGKQSIKSERNPAILEAHVPYGCTLKEIAENIDIHYTTVSKVI